MHGAADTDVVGINLKSRKIVWRFPMEGYRSDHMGVSPDGRRPVVSDSTANKVHELNISTGRKLRECPSGDTPHENNYSEGGRKIFHASIGRVYTPTDQPAFDTQRVSVTCRWSATGTSRFSSAGTLGTS